MSIALKRTGRYRPNIAVALGLKTVFLVMAVACITSLCAAILAIRMRRSSSRQM